MRHCAGEWERCGGSPRSCCARAGIGASGDGPRARKEWLAKQQFAEAAHHFVFKHLVDDIAEAQAAVKRSPSATKRALLEEQPAAIRPIAKTRESRLHRRYKALIKANKSSKIAATASAREQAGFVWAVGREVTIATSRLDPARPRSRAGWQGAGPR